MQRDMFKIRVETRAKKAANAVYRDIREWCRSKYNDAFIAVSIKAQVYNDLVDSLNQEHEQERLNRSLTNSIFEKSVDLLVSLVKENAHVDDKTFESLEPIKMVVARELSRDISMYDSFYLDSGFSYLDRLLMRRCEALHDVAAVCSSSQDRKTASECWLNRYRSSALIPQLCAGLSNGNVPLETGEASSSLLVSSAPMSRPMQVADYLLYLLAHLSHVKPVS